MMRIQRRLRSVNDEYRRNSQCRQKFNERLVVDHLQATIEQGEIFGLLGPNGAGKSTTIHMLSGLLPIDAGEIKVNGYSVTSQTMEVKRRIGLVPQDLAIYEQMTARDNVTFSRSCTDCGASSSKPASTRPSSRSACPTGRAIGRNRSPAG